MEDLIGDPFGDRAFLEPLRGVFRDRARYQRYLNDGLERIQVVLRLLDDLRRENVHRILELGVNPYTMSLLIRRRFGNAFDSRFANYFGDSKPDRSGLDVVQLDHERIEFPYEHFNIERDRFPYDDRSFDAVLFCEILEHLLENPDQVAREIARVLRPRGFVICFRYRNQLGCPISSSWLKGAAFGSGIPTMVCTADTTASSRWAKCKGSWDETASRSIARRFATSSVWHVATPGFSGCDRPCGTSICSWSVARRE